MKKVLTLTGAVLLFGAALQLKQTAVANLGLGYAILVGADKPAQGAVAGAGGVAGAAGAGAGVLAAVEGGATIGVAGGVVGVAAGAIVGGL